MSPTPNLLCSTLALWVIAIFRSMGSSTAFLQYDASSFPTSSLSDHHLSHRRSVLITHSPLSATKHHSSFNVLDIPSSTISTPSYDSLQSGNVFVPFENPAEYQQESLQSKPTDKLPATASSKSTFKSKLNTYQPFFMNFGTTTNAEATTAGPPRHSQSTKSLSSASSPSTPKLQVSKTFSIGNKDPVTLPFGGSRTSKRHVDAYNHPIASAVSKADVHQQTVNSINRNGSRLPVDPLREMKRQRVPSTKASTGAKVVETLAKAYAHPIVPDLPLPAMTSSIIAPSIHSEERTDGATKQDSIDWRSRLKALEEAVLSLTQQNKNPEAQNKNIVVDANASPATLLEQVIVPSSGKKDRDQGRSWNMIEKLKQQLDALQDKVHDLEKYETKTIHWVIPKVDKHIRPTAASTFRSDPFFVGSTPFHLELQVQEPTGVENATEEQSVSFYLWHHHRRMQHHRYPQSHHHLRPFRDPEQKEKTSQHATARHSSHTSHSLPIQLPGSKLTIGGCEYTFSDSAAIELGKQDGWGWRRLMSLKELRQHKCIRNGQFDIQFQVRMKRLNHDSSRIGVAMIS